MVHKCNGARTVTLTTTIGGKVCGCIGLVGIVVHYTLLFFIVEIRGLSLIIVLMGPPP